MISTPWKTFHWKVTPENWVLRSNQGPEFFLVVHSVVNMISIKFLKRVWDTCKRLMVETCVRNSQLGNVNKSWWDFRNFHFIISLTGSSDVDRCAHLVILWSIYFNIFHLISISYKNNFLGFCQVTKGLFTLTRNWKRRIEMKLWYGIWLNRSSVIDWTKYIELQGSYNSHNISTSTNNTYSVFFSKPQIEKRKINKIKRKYQWSFAFSSCYLF